MPPGGGYPHFRQLWVTTKEGKGRTPNISITVWSPPRLLFTDDDDGIVHRYSRIDDVVPP